MSNVGTRRGEKSRYRRGGIYPPRVINRLLELANSLQTQGSARIARGIGQDTFRFAVDGFDWSLISFGVTITDADKVTVEAGDLILPTGNITIASGEVTITGNPDINTPAYPYILWNIGAASGEIVSTALGSKPSCDVKTMRRGLCEVYYDADGLLTIGHRMVIGDISLLAIFDE